MMEVQPVVQFVGKVSRLHNKTPPAEAGGVDLPIVLVTGLTDTLIPPASIPR